MTTRDEPRRRGRPSSGGREAILSAALELLRQGGVAKLTSREVAARAGVSDASVYYHFGDREGLLKAVFAHGLKPLEFLDGGHPEMGLAAVLAAAVESLVAFFDEAVPVMAAAQSEVVLGGTLATYIEENDLGPHRGVATLSAYLRRGQAAGEINPAVDPEAVALMIIDLAFANSWRRHALWLDPEDGRLPSVTRMLATIEQMLALPGG